MPCFSDYPNDDLPQLRKELDQVTALLCAVCTKLDRDPARSEVLKLVKGLPKWWKHHQAADDARKAKEKHYIKRQVEELKRNIRASSEKLEELKQTLNYAQEGPPLEPSKNHPVIQLMIPGTKGLDRKGTISSFNAKRLVVLWKRAGRPAEKQMISPPPVLVWSVKRGAWTWRPEKRKRS